MQWIKVKDRMPDKEGRFAVKRLGEIMVCNCEKRANGEYVFTIQNGMTFKGYKDFEWLDEENEASLTKATIQILYNYIDSYLKKFVSHNPNITKLENK